MSHSKRNTSLAFFTSYERSLLRSQWGSQATRLTRDSFLPFGSCQLCLLPSTDPVACGGGEIVTDPSRPPRKHPASRLQCHVFCRECIVSNLLAQRKDLKRLGREAEVRSEDAAAVDAIEDEEAGRRAVEEFERVQMGLEVKLGGSGGGGGKAGPASATTRERKIVGREDGKAIVEETVPDTDGANGGGGGRKRKFELDEEELLRIAKDERAKARKALSDEKTTAARSGLSFWVPGTLPASSTPGTTTTPPSTKKHKPTPLCPGSASTAPHELSLKTLLPVHFTTEGDRGASTNTSTPPAAADRDATRTCPACSRPLTNAGRALLAKPCGHVMCSACVDKFLTADVGDPHGEEQGVRCFVCSEDLSGSATSGKAKIGDAAGRREREREAAGRSGLMEISSEGTGFAGGGGNMVKRTGVAFQC